MSKNSNKISINILVYLIIIFGHAFLPEYTLAEYITRGPVMTTLVINSLWLLINIITNKTE